MLLARFLSVRYWMRHRGAFFLAMLGIALGIAVFVAIQVANNSVLASFSSTLQAMTGKANLQIVAGHNGLPDDLVARIHRLDDRRIVACAPTISATLYSPTLKSSLLVQGIDLFAESDFRDYKSHLPEEVKKQHEPADYSFLLDPHAIAISRAMAQQHRLAIGSVITCYAGANRVVFRVVQILDSSQLDNAYGGDFAIIDIAAAQEALGKIGNIDGIDLIVADNAVAAVAARLRDMAPPDAVVQRPARNGVAVRNLLAAFQLNLTALSCISLFVGAFLIYNAIATAVVRRRVEVGTLRALGASRSQIMRLFLTEAAGIGLVGSVCGFALGLLLAHYALAAVSTTVSLLYASVHARHQVVPAYLWWEAPAGGVALAVVSAVPAAWEAAGIAPRAALQRGTVHLKATAWVVPFALAGVAVLALGLLLSLPLANRQSSFAGFAAVFCTLGGFALLAPLVALHGGRLGRTAAGRALGIEGTLAGTYLQRALGRSSLVIAALMVSLAMSIGLSVMVRSFRGTVANWIESTVSADLYVAPATGFSGEMGTGLPREVIDYVMHLPAVLEADTLRVVRLQVGNQPVQISANDLPTLLSGRRHLHFIATAHGDAAARAIYKTNEGILVSERFRSLIGLGAGDSLKLPTPSGPKSFFIAGVFTDYTPDECLLYMPRPLYRRYWHDDHIDGIALYLKPGTSEATLQYAIERRFSSRYQLTLLPNGRIRASALKTFDQTFAVTYALQLIAVLVAAIGIFDTLIALLLERSRELATLRALGASAAQIMKMTLIEFGMVGLLAWVLGVAAGLVLAWQLIFVINRQFFGWTISFGLPLANLWQSLALAMLAAVGAGVLPAFSAARRNIAEALQTE